VSPSPNSRPFARRLQGYAPTRGCHRRGFQFICFLAVIFLSFLCPPKTFVFPAFGCRYYDLLAGILKVEGWFGRIFFAPHLFSSLLWSFPFPVMKIMRVLITLRNCWVVPPPSFFAFSFGFFFALPALFCSQFAVLPEKKLRVQKGVLSVIHTSSSFFSQVFFSPTLSPPNGFPPRGGSNGLQKFSPDGAGYSKLVLPPSPSPLLVPFFVFFQ